MPSYNVHTYAVVRIKVAGVEAETPEAAISLLNKDNKHLLEASRLIFRDEPKSQIDQIELDDGSQPVGYLVDLVDNGEITDSVSYDVNAKGDLVPIGSPQQP